MLRKSRPSFQAKEKYDAARFKLLGLDDSPLDAQPTGDNPFR